MKFIRTISDVIDDNLRIFRTLALIFAILFFVVVGIFSSYLASVREEIRNLKSTNYLLTNTVNDQSTEIASLRDRLKTDNGASEDEGSEGSGTDNTDPFAVDPRPDIDEDIIIEEKTYYYKSNDTNTVFDQVAPDVFFPIYSLNNSSIKDGVKYYESYYEKESGIEYEAAWIHTTLVKNDIEVVVHHGKYSTGGACTDTFEISTNRGEEQVCVNGDYFTIALMDESVNTKVGYDINYSFEVSGNYTQDEIAQLFAEFTMFE